MRQLAPIGDNPLNRWLQKERMCAEQERQLERIAMEVGQDVPDQTHFASLPGDPWLLRGIPVVGVHGGVGGAIPGTKPHAVR